MPSHVALLRGVNVGGRNKIAMADLRAVFSEVGHTDVATYIQSGNVVFSGPDAESTALAEGLERAIAQRLGVSPGVVVVSRAKLEQVIAANPYPGEPNPKYVHVVFRRDDMEPDEVAAVTTAVQRAREKGSRDEAQVAAGTLYLHTPDGLGRSVLAELLSRPQVTGIATMRNWATVIRLQHLLDA